MAGSESQNSSSSSTPELLAPAGTLKAFHAAVEAGADAVYLGLQQFNARLRAPNFSVKTLSYLTPWAHSRGAKVYVTLNTQLKQQELRPAIDVVYQLSQIGVDAIIVADLGLVGMARRYFPRLRLHASTQMTITDSAGVRAAKRLGLARVTLARELTLDDIESVCRRSPLEIEVFVHGAVCYSVSGLCLASSWFGGLSGNRGRCTQVCRRIFEDDRRRGYFFSPRDLSALSHLPRLVRAGVRSLKIEGRMKGVEYVDTVVRTWRRALDEPERIPRLLREVDRDMGRPKTDLFLSGALPGDAVNAAGASGTGIDLGEVRGVKEDRVLVSTSETICAGDRIRVHPRSGFEGVGRRVLRCEPGEDGTALVLKDTAGMGRGDRVFLTSRAGEGRLRRTPRIESAPARFRPSYPSVGRVLKSVSPPRQPPADGDRLMIKVDSLEWLELAAKTRCSAVTASLAPAELQSLRRERSLLSAVRERLFVCTPPFVPESAPAGTRRTIDFLLREGIRGIVAENLAEIGSGDRSCETIAGTWLRCTNGASWNRLREAGCSGFVHSLEDDILNLKHCAGFAGMVVLFAHAPLFVSRIEPTVPAGRAVRDSDGVSMRVEVRDGLFYLIADRPLCLTHKRSRLHALGFRDFILDLSFTRPDRSFLKTLLRHYHEETRVADSSLFNFKRGLR